MQGFDDRLSSLRAELDNFVHIATHLGLDFERPLRSLGDGYPENTITLVGKIAERILKALWRHHDVPGDPTPKALNDLIKGCRPYIHSTSVVDAFSDIQRLRNRSTHEGYDVAEEDALTAIRRLLDVLVWFTSTAPLALSGRAPVLAPEVEQRATFLSGLYITLDFRLTKRFELSPDTVYQLFTREAGLRNEYVELLLSKDPEELRLVIQTLGGELLKTSMPKLTRFVILDEVPIEDISALLGMDWRVVSYSRFADTIVDLPAHHFTCGIDTAATDRPRLPIGHVPLTGELLGIDEQTGELRVTQVGDADQLLRQVAEASGNLFVTGRAGSGKTTLLKGLVAEGVQATTRRYRFYFDMSLKPADEDFGAFVTRTLAPCFSVEQHRVFDLFLYLIRSGSVVCVLDAVDEGLIDVGFDGFMSLFAEIAQILSAESAVIFSSRVSFLEDSPHVRQLLSRSALVSERIVQEISSNGIDPLRLPAFSVLKLHDVQLNPNNDTQVGSPLEFALAAELDGGPGVEPNAGALLPLGELIGRRIDRLLAEGGIAESFPALVDVFGKAGLDGRRVVTLFEIANEVGIDCFRDGRLSFESCALAPILRPVDSDRVALIHSVFHEFLVAHHLFERYALAGEPPPKQALITEQIRAFLGLAGRRLNRPLPRDAADGQHVLEPGTYLVGPSHHLRLRRVERPVEFDRYPVTVDRYKAFLEAVRANGSADWDHPDKPPEISHEPFRERVRHENYYEDPTYGNYPAMCLTWWSAYAFARYEGKRLATPMEWEAAARGRDGRLFPWGDDYDLQAANSADYWIGKPLVTYEAWKEEFDRGRLRAGLPTPVDAFPRNRSPIGVRDMSGNVWEWTGKVFEDSGQAVICGGSFDNPYRAIQASSKGFYRLEGRSNVVGFRCVKDLR